MGRTPLIRVYSTLSFSPSTSATQEESLPKKGRLRGQLPLLIEISTTEVSGRVSSCPPVTNVFNWRCRKQESDVGLWKVTPGKSGPMPNIRVPLVAAVKVVQCRVRMARPESEDQVSAVRRLGSQDSGG